MLTLLLDNRVDANDTREYEETMLYTALRDNKISAVKVLLERGGDPHFFEEGMDESTFSHAIEYSSLNIIEFLLEYIESDKVNSYGGHCGTALQRAVSIGRKDALRLLILYKSDVNLNLSIYGSALHQAATAGHVSVVSYLMSRGANPNTYCEQGSLLQATLSYSNSPVVNSLLSYSEIDVKTRVVIEMLSSKL